MTPDLSIHILPDRESNDPPPTWASPCPVAHRAYPPAFATASSPGPSAKSTLDMAST
jgi:hypothetical protein